MFKREGEDNKITIKNLQQILEFDENAKADVVSLLNERLSKLQYQKEIKQQELDHLPKNLKDDSKV